MLVLTRKPWSHVRISIHRTWPISIDLYDLIEKIYQTLKTVLDRISKHLDVRQKYPLRDVFSTLLSVFGNVVKLGLSSLICYIKTEEAALTNYQILAAITPKRIKP